MVKVLIRTKKECVDLNHARAYAKKVIANNDKSVKGITVWLTDKEYVFWAPGKGWTKGSKAGKEITV